mmetsp:Transcript_56379/g.134598  ORF Transcript_56379/g.134598 Transcript_56379/m.134598 type:complete len:231 (-) Transcript_56379:151-843(-)
MQVTVVLQASPDLTLDCLTTFLAELLHRGAHLATLAPELCHQALNVSTKAVGILLLGCIGITVWHLHGRASPAFHLRQRRAKAVLPRLLQGLQPLLHGHLQAVQPHRQRLLQLQPELCQLLVEHCLGPPGGAVARQAGHSALHPNFLQLLAHQAPLQVPQLPDAATQLLQRQVTEMRHNDGSCLHGHRQLLIFQGITLVIAEAEGRLHLKLRRHGPGEGLLQSFWPGIWR